MDFMDGRLWTAMILKDEDSTAALIMTGDSATGMAGATSVARRRFAEAEHVVAVKLTSVMRSAAAAESMVAGDMEAAGGNWRSFPLIGGGRRRKLPAVLAYTGDLDL